MDSNSTSQEEYIYYNSLKKTTVKKTVGYYNNAQIVTESLLDVDMIIYIRTVAIKCTESESSIKIPYIKSISNLLYEYSDKQYNFEANISGIRKSIFTELFYDRLFVMKKYFPENEIFEIKIDEDRVIFGTFMQLPEGLPIFSTNGNDKDNDNDNNEVPSPTDSDMDTLSIPYFKLKQKISNGNKMIFCDIPYIVKSVNTDNRMSETVLRNIYTLQIKLYQQYGAMLRDYFRYVSNITDKKHSDSDYKSDDYSKTFERVDPIKNNFNVIKNVSSQCIYTSDIEDKYKGSLSTTTLIRDNPKIRSELGTLYTDDLSAKSRIINVALHSMSFDDPLINNENNYVNIIEKMYCRNNNNTNEMSNNTYHFAFIYHIDGNGIVNYSDIKFCMYSTNKKLKALQNTSPKKFDAIEFIEFLSQQTYLDVAYIYYLLKRLVPFIFESDKGNTNNEGQFMNNIKDRLNNSVNSPISDDPMYKITEKNNVTITPIITNNLHSWKTKISEYYKKLSNEKPSVIFFYNDVDDYFKRVVKFPDYQSIVYDTNCIGSCNLDHFMILLLLRKEGHKCFMDFDYDNVIKDSLAVFRTSLQIAKLCHMNIHELFYGGKMLWHLRYLEYVMLNTDGYSKPYRLSVSRTLKNNPLESGEKEKEKEKERERESTHMQDHFSEYKYEKWKLKGAYIGANNIKGYVNNKSVFFDYDAQYFSVICEYSMGFGCHEGFKSISNTNENNSEDDESNINESLSLNVTEEPAIGFESWINIRRQVKKTNGKDSPTYLALKLLNNSFYGCIASNSSPIRSKLMGNWITYGGRVALSKAYIVANQFNINVLMAQTDSICLLEPNKNNEHLYKGARINTWKLEYMTCVNSYFPKKFVYICIEDEFEKMFCINRNSYTARKVITTTTTTTTSTKSIELIIDNLVKYMKQIILDVHCLGVNYLSQTCAITKITDEEIISSNNTNGIFFCMIYLWNIHKNINREFFSLFKSKGVTNVQMSLLEILTINYYTLFSMCNDMERQKMIKLLQFDGLFNKNGEELCSILKQNNRNKFDNKIIKLTDYPYIRLASLSIYLLHAGVVSGYVIFLTLRKEKSKHHPLVSYNNKSQLTVCYALLSKYVENIKKHSVIYSYTPTDSCGTETTTTTTTNGVGNNKNTQKIIINANNALKICHLLYLLGFELEEKHLTEKPTKNEPRLLKITPTNLSNLILCINVTEAVSYPITPMTLKNFMTFSKLKNEELLSEDEIHNLSKHLGTNLINNITIKDYRPNDKHSHILNRSKKNLKFIINSST